MNKPQTTAPHLDECEYFEETHGHDPEEVIRAQKAADKLSAELGEPLELSWFLTTRYLQQLKLTHRARARQALWWRPKFLFALGGSCSFTFAARAAGVAYNTFLLHQRNDPEFAAQVADAEAQAVDLLQARCFKAAIEGELEPVYQRGEIVGRIRKFDNRLRIELLRAHMPNTFKTPGREVKVNTSSQIFSGQQIICDESVLLELQAMRQESLRKIAEKMAQASTVVTAPAEGVTKLPT